MNNNMLRKMIAYEKVSPSLYDNRFKDLEFLEDIEIKKMREFSNYQTQKKILDIGCGTGISVKIFPKDLIVGVDNIKKFIDYCQKHKKNKNRRFFVADMGNIPVKKETFDLILLLGTLESDKDPIKKAKTFLKYLKKDGIIIFTFWNSRNAVAKMINWGARKQYKRTQFSLNYIKRNIKIDKDLDYKIKTNYVIPPGTLFFLLLRIPLLKLLAKQFLISLEKINERFNLYLGCDWLVSINRK